TSPTAALLLSVHPYHTFAPPIVGRLSQFDREMALGVVSLPELILHAGPALHFVAAGLQRCGIPFLQGLLPGYCFFRRGTMLAWHPGLPTPHDAAVLARGALFGALWAAASGDVRHLLNGIRSAAEHAAADHVVGHFEAAAREDQTAGGPGGSDAPRPTGEDLSWAYARLGVDASASDHEINTAWKRLRILHHPDHAAEDPAEFQRRSRLSADVNRARDIITASRRADTGAYARAS
ncbi:MAG: DnaJ domain-containing protein, partial [Vicinamibacterales bacterium]